MQKFRVRLVTPKIIHLVFSSKEEMCKTILRFQEHFESPEFCGKVFTLAEFKKWYTAKHGSFTYYSDWAGFNFPSSNLKKFLDGSFNPLSAREKSVIKAIKDATSTLEEGASYYVIATPGGKVSAKRDDALRHELGHALYFTNPDYRRQVDVALSELPAREYPMEKLRQIGYHESVLWDELHAFLIDGMPYFSKITGVNEVFRKDILKQYEKAAKILAKALDAALEKEKSKVPVQNVKKSA